MALLASLYALAVYVIFLGTLLYTIGFVADMPMLPRTLDGGPAAPPGLAVSVDLALFTLFAVQHSVMARRGFKRWWTRLVPASVERATYVLAATGALALLLWQWRPIAEPVLWTVRDPAWRGVVAVVFWSGWGLQLVSTWLIDHFELFGLRQPWARLRGLAPPTPVFGTPLLYRHVRHPLYLGFLLAFWATPRMTAGHALFAAASTVYIFIGIWFEERDLVAQFGQRYLAYRRQVGMLLPKPGRSTARGPADS